VISYKVARRSFLLGCGGSAALLAPLLRSMEARAAGAPAPLRFLAIHHPLGAQLGPYQVGATYGTDNWRPAATATTKSFTLPFESAPFAPLQSYMVMIDGVNIVCANKSGGYAGANTHEGGMVALMTGQPTLGQIGQQDHVAGGASIDQILLAKSPVLGGAASITKTPFGSLQLAADIRSDRDEVAPRVMSYLDPDLTQTLNSNQRRPLYAETQPLNTFNRVFGGVMMTSGGGGADGGVAPISNTVQLMAQKKSILDFMRADLARLRTLAPSSEKIRLDAFTDAITQLEASIQASLGTLMAVQAGDGGVTSNPGSVVCAKPATPMSFVETGTGASGSLAPANGTKLSGLDYYDPKNPANHPHFIVGQLQLAMIKAAFACDLVRVATFMWAAGTDWVVFPGTLNGASIAGSLTSTPHHPPSHATDAGTISWLSQVNQMYSAQTAQALQTFQSATDVDGNSLLDNTVVAYVTEVSRAHDHHQENMPFLVFGGKNTRVQGGTFLKVTGGSLPSIDTDGSKTTNRPTNDVWLSLASVFGVTMTSLGAASQSTGPLPGVVV
jgi:hypothetical protein